MSTTMRWLSVAVLAAMGMSSSYGPRARVGPLASAERVAYHPDSSHPWNRVFAALHGRDLQGPAPACLASKTTRCASIEESLRLDASVARQESAERLIPLYRGSTDWLLETGASDHVLRLLEEAAHAAPLPNPVAAVLFQRDLWECFDDLSRDIVGEEERDSLARSRLRAGVGRLIRAVALPEDELRAVPSNLPSLVRSHPDLLEGLDRPAPWTEIFIRCCGEEPNAKDGTIHASTAGNRSVFRVLARVPARGTSEFWSRMARHPDSAELPTGTQVAILEHPLALSRSGSLVPLPLVTSLETRTVLPPSPEPRLLSELTFDVLEGRRRLLIAGETGGGLVRLDPAEPFTRGGSCAPGQGWQPMRAACLMCHDKRGARIPGLRRHGHQSLHAVTPDPARGVTSVIEAKQAQPDYQALAAFFQGR